jgi:hypothetical protein
MVNLHQLKEGPKGKNKISINISVTIPHDSI